MKTLSKTSLSTLFSQLFDFFYPPRCLLCGEYLDTDAGDHPPLCHDCTRSFSSYRAAGSIKGDHYERCYSAMKYREPFRNSFHRYKFRGSWYYGEVYGQWMWDCIEREEIPIQKFDVISWTPLSRFRYFKRGYDQSQLLAKEIAQRSGLTLCSLLEKRKHIQPLSGVHEQEWRNKLVKGAYRMKCGANAAGQRILLIDDVTTTGSTLEEASRVLMEDGAREVWCLTLARAGERAVE